MRTALRVALTALVFAFLPASPGPSQANPCNPCAPANPCNPCAGENPCNPCGGPLGRIEPSRFRQPEGSATPAKSAALVARGQALWSSREVSNGRAACADCHRDDYTMINETFAEPYPHFVQMVELRSGVKQVNAAEMVNFCMMAAMSSEPLAWDSAELAALTAYVENIRPGYTRRTRGAPATNPCNPCGGNPCNPCGGR
jgi:hypothetical protein